MMKLFSHLLIFIIALACSESKGEFVAAEDISVESVEAPQAKSQSSGNNTQSIIGKYVIRTASLTYETGDLSQAYNNAVGAAKRNGAVLQNEEERVDNDRIYRSLTFRVPADRFDSFLSDIGKNVDYFENRQISSQDVSEEYIDVEARLATKKALEARYMTLLQKAYKISEIIEIEKELANVRAEIESMEGRLRYLRDRVSLSTVNLSIYKVTEIGEGTGVSYGSKIWNAIKSGFNNILGFMIALLHIWPFIVILVAAAWLIRRRWRKKKNL